MAQYTLRNSYAGFVLSMVELHKRLQVCVAEIEDEQTATLYLNMVLPFLCALNKMELLQEVEARMGARLCELPPKGLREAAGHIMQLVGPPPDMGDLCSEP
jgi:hypothetical protein